MGAFGPHGGPITRGAVSLFSHSERADLREIRAVNEVEGAVLAPEFSCPDEHQIRLAAELTDIQTFVSEDSQELSGLWLNRSTEKDVATERPLLLVAGGFLSSVATVDGKYRAYHLARQFPDHQILVYDQPSHGHSSPFSKHQRKAMAHGDMSDVGQQIFTAVEDFTKSNLAPVSYFVAKGESFGSRGLLDVADVSRDTSLKIDALTLFELPGTEDDRRLDIHTSYFGFEWLRSSYYGAKIGWWSDHKQVFKTFLEEYSGQALADEPKSFFVRDPIMAAGNFYNSVLGHGSGQPLLERLVLEDVLVVRSTAAKGRIDRLYAAETRRREMLSREGQAWGQIALLHESHDGSGFAPRARITAKLADFSLRQAGRLSALSDSYPTTMRRVQEGNLIIPEEMKL